jgi:peroxiredoxin Q/BCP
MEDCRWSRHLRAEYLKKEENMPKEGSKAPAFCLPSADKDKVCLKDFYGKWVVLYFYPKDSTSG